MMNRIKIISTAQIEQVIMLVKCSKPFRHQLSENNVYLVIEILTKFSNKSVSYRLIDNEGYPSIYDADRFEVVSNKIDNFAVLLNDDGIILSHELIVNSELNIKSIDGFWGLFIEDDIDAKQILKEVIKDLSIKEKYNSTTFSVI